MPNILNDHPLYVSCQSRREFLQSAGTAGLALMVAGPPALAAPASKRRWHPTEMAGMPMWDYTRFGGNTIAAPPDGRFELVSQKILGGRGGFNRWTINGKSWPETDPLTVEPGKRYRLVFNNDSGDMHPMHLHRHSFELVSVAGTPSSGILKDVVNVPAHKVVEVDFVADNPGLTLLHCHMQEHMDFGFMNLVKYA